MLRRATIDDIPVIRDLAHAIWWAHYPGIITEEQIAYMLEQMYSAEALHQQMTDQGVHFWLVQTNKNEPPSGFAAVSRPEEGSYFLHKFYLAASEQGKGFGTRVFHELLSEYPDLRELCLTVNRQNYKSINFYFKIGFRIEKCADFLIGNGYVMNDFVMLWKKPSPEPTPQP